MKRKEGRREGRKEGRKEALFFLSFLSNCDILQSGFSGTEEGKGGASTAAAALGWAAKLGSYLPPSLPPSPPLITLPTPRYYDDDLGQNQKSVARPRSERANEEGGT